MSDALPFSEVKAHLSELADRVERQHDRFLVTRNGRPSFVLLSPDDLESIFGPIVENPTRLSKPLVGELEGLWSARRGDYRIIHEIFDDEQIVLIHRVQHRRDAYRPR